MSLGSLQPNEESHKWFQYSVKVKAHRENLWPKEVVILYWGAGGMWSHGGKELASKKRSEKVQKVGADRYLGLIRNSLTLT